MRTDQPGRDGDGRSEALECRGENGDGQLGELGDDVMLEPTPIRLPIKAD